MFVALLAGLTGCATHHNVRALSVGGVHALGGAEPCRLALVEPPSALEDLHWQNGLVARANVEGHADLACGSEHFRLRLVTPARLELALVDDHAAAGQPFFVRAIVRDQSGHELELGKWTAVAWLGDGNAEPWEDRSAAEFGFGGGTFGVHGFKASSPGTVTVEGKLGTAVGTLRVVVKP